MKPFEQTRCDPAKARDIVYSGSFRGPRGDSIVVASSRAGGTVARVSGLAALAMAALLGWGHASPALADAGLVAPPVHLSPDAARRLIAWRALVRTNATGSERTKLERVNAFFNRLHYAADSAAAHGGDEWATPREFLLRNAGDCEDFALAKYFTLRDMGVAARRLRLMYVRTLPRRAAHMVLTYQTKGGDGDILVLDNLRADILPLSRRPDLLPVYSFNAIGLWLTKPHGQAVRVGSSDRLSRWQNLLRRLRRLPGGFVY